MGLSSHPALVKANPVDKAIACLEMMRALFSMQLCAEGRGALAPNTREMDVQRLELVEYAAEVIDELRLMIMTPMGRPN